MFDLNSTDGSTRKTEYKSPIPGSDAEGAQQLPPNKLDGPTATELHRRLMDYYVRELDKQHDNRVQMAIEEDFYDNIQWSEEDAAEVEARGQKPIVYNVISASIDWVTGTEKRARSDFSILPRRKEEGKTAQRKTELMKYLSDVNRTPFHVSRAFTDAVKVGLGWLEDGITDGAEDEPLFSRYESWRNILWDSNATELDLADGRYLFRTKWMDLDTGCAMFPKRKGVVQSAAAASDDYISLDAYADEAMDSQEMILEGNRGSTSERVSGYQRQRVRVIEAWIRLPVTTPRFKGGPFHGEIYDGASRGHFETLQEGMASGKVSIVKKVSMRMHVAIFTQTGMLWLSESPYRHNQFPFTPIWGKRRGRDGLPYGMIRGLKDIQEDINKRASKALYIMSTNKIIMDHDAVDDIDELREEAARPDGIIVKTRGSQLELNADRDLPQYQLEMMGRSISMIQQASGVTDELMGRETGAKSGIAIQRRQDQGSMATALYFDNLRLATQLRGEKQLANIEQFMDEPKQFRITNQRGKPEYVEVNDGLPENDIVRSKADYIISDADWHATMRQAAVDQLLEMVAKLPPQVGLVLLDLVVENMDIANREEIVKRIRGMTGQTDPDAEEISPEQQQQMAAKQEADALAKRQVLAEVGKTEADAERLLAQAEKTRAEISGTRVTTQGKALETAANALTLPSPVVHTADYILAEAEAGTGSPSPAAPPAAPPMPPQALGVPQPPPAPAV